MGFGSAWPSCLFLPHDQSYQHGDAQLVSAELRCVGLSISIKVHVGPLPFWLKPLGLSTCGLRPFVVRRRPSGIGRCRMAGRGLLTVCLGLVLWQLAIAKRVLPDLEPSLGGPGSLVECSDDARAAHERSEEVLELSRRLPRELLQQVLDFAAFRLQVAMKIGSTAVAVFGGGRHGRLLSGHRGEITGVKLFPSATAS